MADADGLRCVPITDDTGTVIGRARVSGPLTERTREALRAVVDAVHRQQAEEDAADPAAAAERGARQQAAIARVRRRVGLLADTDGNEP